MELYTKSQRSWSKFFANEENLVHMPMNDLYTEARTVNEAHMMKFGLLRHEPQ